MASSGWTGSPSVLLLHNIDPGWLPPEREEAGASVAALVQGLVAEGLEVAPRAVEGPDIDEALGDAHPDDVVVLNWCEGLPGVPRSEALVTALLDERGFTYTGSPTRVLELSWDKPLTKRRLWRTGVPTPVWRTFASPAVDEWGIFPAIVKPSHEHCSLGVTSEAVVHDRGALAERVAFVLEELGQPAIVEQFIGGREFHVSVWGNGTLRVLPPAEMDFSALSEPDERLCTFDSKFTPGSRQWDSISVVVPAPLDEPEQQELARVTIAAYRALGCRDYARVDLRQDGSGFTVLDVNPNCDLSPETSTAIAAELAMGSYGALLGRIVALAAARKPTVVERRLATPLLACCAS
jgi:D-alanine-D-alanine ligase